MSNSQNGIRKRILFASVPGDGHFNPLTGLAKYLKGKGYDVRWYASAAYRQKLEKLELHHYPFTKALDVPSDKIDEIFPERKKIRNQIRKLNFDMINYFILRSTEYLEDIRDINRDWPIDAIVADCLFSAIPFLSPVLHIPVISIGVVPLIQNSKDLAPCGLGMEPSYTMAGKIKQELLKKLTTNVLLRKPNKIFFSLLEKLNIPPNASNAFDALVNSATYFLQSGTPGMEYYRSDLGKNIHYIGAVLPYADRKYTTGKWYDDKLKQYEKVILVTQGTVEKDVQKLIVPAIEAFRESNTLLIVTTGGSQTEELRSRYPLQNVIIEDFIDFDDVMPHADLFITNGGYGGVLKAIQHGLPMVAAGVHEGKNEICARIGFLKYGINLKTETPKPQQVKKAVDQIFVNDTCRQNVHKLSTEFSQYDVNTLFEKYVNDAINKNVHTNEN